jgi:IS30 family transposase
MSKKVGNLSEADRRYIVNHHKKESIEDIAEALNRTPELIKRHLMQKGLYIEKTDDEIEQENRMKMTLYNLAYWPTIIAAYDDEEIKLYEDNWLSIVKQLNEDVTYTEHLAIQSWLIMVLERHRILAKKKEQAKSIRD